MARWLGREILGCGLLRVPTLAASACMFDRATVMSPATSTPCATEGKVAQ